MTRDSPKAKSVMDGIRLRPFAEADLDLLVRSSTDQEFSAPYEWSGFRSPETYRRRWAEDGLLGSDPRFLAITANETSVGFVNWRELSLFGRLGAAWEIGVLLAPEHRGRGFGTEAQRLLVAYLFDVTTAHRVCAFTELANEIEQRSLEKCGFRREGVMRQAGFRGGAWRDVVAYSCVREDTDRA